MKTEEKLDLIASLLKEVANDFDEKAELIFIDNIESKPGKIKFRFEEFYCGWKNKKIDESQGKKIMLDIIKGKDVLGRTQYVLLNKQIVKNMGMDYIGTEPKQLVREFSGQTFTLGTSTSR